MPRGRTELGAYRQRIVGRRARYVSDEAELTIAVIVGGIQDHA